MCYVLLTVLTLVSLDFSRQRRPLFRDCSNRRASSTRQCSRTTGYQHDGHVCNISWWRMIVGLHADSSAISTFPTTQFVVQTRSLFARRLVSQCSRVTTVYHRWYRHTHLNRPYFTLFAHSTTDYDDLCSEPSGTTTPVEHKVAAPYCCYVCWRRVRFQQKKNTNTPASIVPFSCVLFFNFLFLFLLYTFHLVCPWRVRRWKYSESV